MARNVTHFEFAERGPTSVYKFRVAKDPTTYVWFEYAGDGGSLHVTSQRGPYSVEHELKEAEFADLEELLKARGTTRRQWVEDLMAQFGERLEWTYP